MIDQFNVTNSSYLMIDKFNVTNSSYLMIDKFNVTNTTYRILVNNTFVGNINASISNITINYGNFYCLMQNCSSYIYNNGTHGIWK
jgi:hypothetical protein